MPHRFVISVKFEINRAAYVVSRKMHRYIGGQKFADFVYLRLGGGEFDLLSREDFFELIGLFFGHPPERSAVSWPRDELVRVVEGSPAVARGDVLGGDYGSRRL
jgi:hypothetical protein